MLETFDTFATVIHVSAAKVVARLQLKDETRLLKQGQFFIRSFKHRITLDTVLSNDVEPFSVSASKVSRTT